MRELVPLCRECQAEPAMVHLQCTLCELCWLHSFRATQPPQSHPAEIAALYAQYDFGPTVDGRSVADIRNTMLIAEGQWIDARFVGFHVELVLAPLIGGLRMCRFVLLGDPRVHPTLAIEDYRRIPNTPEGVIIHVVLRLRIWRPGEVGYYDLWWDMRTEQLAGAPGGLPLSAPVSRYESLLEVLRPSPRRGRRSDPIDTEAQAACLNELCEVYTALQEDRRNRRDFTPITLAEFLSARGWSGT